MHFKPIQLDGHRPGSPEPPSYRHESGNWINPRKFEMVPLKVFGLVQWQKESARCSRRSRRMLHHTNFWDKILKIGQNHLSWYVDKRGLSVSISYRFQTGPVPCNRCLNIMEGTVSKRKEVTIMAMATVNISEWNAIPKITMLCNLHCLKARLKLLCNKYQLYSSLNLISQQLKLCNIFIFRMAYCLFVLLIFFDWKRSIRSKCRR